MATMKVRDINRSLLRKGFISKNNDHVYYLLIIDDKKTSVWTKISHGDNEIGDHLINKMANQIFLSKSEFRDLINCPLSKEDYIGKLVERGKIRC